MYSTCLFCNSALGANESIEHFPVGRRLAFDGATGRLWVVCLKCERWNLSPLETRWEAIEEAERAIRSTKLRVATDNIGLAQLKDGTELVRIGAPPTLELAAWRYGDQFGRRQRRFAVHVGTAVVSGKIVAEMVTSTAWLTATSMLPIVGGGIFLTGLSAYMLRLFKLRRLPHYAIRDQDDVLRRFSTFNAQRATLSPTGHAFDWQLRLPYLDVKPGGRLLRVLGIRERGVEGDDVVIRDEAAVRALSNVLPQANLMGGSKRAVSDAVELVNDAPHVQYLLHQASVATPKLALWSVPAGEVPISALPAGLRLALEMSLHHNDERRAMEGELKELEQRWRDADAIAKIADALFLPETVDEKLKTLRTPL